MGTFIQINDANYTYPSGHQALKGISFNVKKGDFLYIYGANGSGKSTIAYLLNGLIPHFFGGRFEGSVKIFDTDTRKKSVSELFTQVGLVLQNAEAQLFNSSVKDELAFGLESLGISATNIECRILETVKLLGIEHLLKRSPDRLSGGEKRMIGIASILCLKPSIIVLDEPYANLDQSNAARVQASLKKVHANGLTVVVIEQRTNGFIEDASKCIVVDSGKIIFDGNPYQAKKIMASMGLIPKYPKRQHTNHSSSIEFFEKKQPLLSANQISCEIDGKKIFTDITFDIFKGQTVALVGNNGAGKTTLIKHLNGLYEPKTGKIKFDGQFFTGKTPAQKARMVGLSFQNPNDQFFKSQVEDELKTGLRIVPKEYQGWKEKICHLFQLNGLLNSSPFKLSEGEKKRVAIASILAMKPRLLILDEPTAGQDGRSKQMLAIILKKLSSQGLTTIVATHDLEFAEAIADRWIILEHGKILKDNRPEVSA